ncbi:MAG: hypothetical protein IH945_07895 [Armatimonadetes bacterium]|nr:hypothetical protein [Armatimonadota bacterium]
MLTAAIILAIALQQKTFDFDHPAAPAPTIVEALGEHIGVKMTADGNLNKDILIVNLKSATQQQAMEWIAHVVEGEWKTDKGVLRLTRPKTTERRQEREDKNEQLAGWVRPYRSIEVPQPINEDKAEILALRIRDAVASAAPAYVGAFPPHAIASITPVHRLAVRIMKEFDPSPFFDMPIGATVYLPFDAASADRRLPQATPAYTSDFETEDRIYATAMRNRSLDLTRNYTLKHIGPGDWESGALKGAISVAKEADRLVTTLFLRWGESGPYRTIGTARLTARPDGYKPLWHDEWQVPCDLPQLTSDFLPLRFPGRLRDGKRTQQVPQTVTDFFTSYDYEPLQLGSHPITVQAAETLGKSVVAMLPDFNWMSFRRLITNMEQPIGPVFDLVSGRQESKIEERDEVVLISPTNPAKQRRMRVPRDLYSAMVKDGLKYGDNFEAYAKYIAKSHPDAVAYDFRLVTSLVTRIENVYSYGAGHQNAIRLYGSLTDGQKTLARNGGVLLGWEVLPPKLRSDWAYILMSEGTVGYPRMQGVEVSAVSVSVGSMEKALAMRSARRARMSALRAMFQQNRVPQGLVVELRREPVLLYGYSTKSNRPLRAMMGNTLVSIVAAKEVDSEYWTEADVFLVRQRTILEIKFMAEGQQHLLSTYWEIPVKEGYEPLSFDQIPESMIEPYRAQIEESKDRFRRIPPASNNPSE